MSWMRRAMARAHLGFRGAFLLCLAFIDIAYGWSLMTACEAATRTAAYQWRAGIMPPRVFAALWIAVGLLLLSQAWAHSDRLAYGAAIVLKLFWAFIAFDSWLFGHARQGWILGSIFLVFGVMSLIVSLWPEPLDSRTVAIMTDDLDDESGGPR